MTALFAIVRYLVRGSDVLTMPKSWLADTDRLAHYEAYTKRQWQQGAIVKDVAAMQRDAFWKAREVKREPAQNLAPFTKRKHG